VLSPLGEALASLVASIARGLLTDRELSHSQQRPPSPPHHPSVREAREGKKAARKRRARQAAVLATERKAAADSAKRDEKSGAPEAGAQCTICLDKKIDCVLLECGHQCACFVCASTLQGGPADSVRPRRAAGLCPICRSPISRVVRTYVP
jgi:hypothetical protein